MQSQNYTDFIWNKNILKEMTYGVRTYLHNMLQVVESLKKAKLFLENSGNY